ncbi:MAG TPA: DUF2232 domain-containing protein [Sedimenticola sp.]|nr:DUF2232 domain-containing protein [Sedimenticola sp.]
MRSLASFAMRGTSQAVMLAALLAMLSLLVPPLSIVSSAVVALVGLRKGPRDGALVVVLAGAACAVLAYLALGNAFSVVGFTLMMWVPVWLLALLLWASRSLSVTLQGGLLMGLVIVAGQYFQDQDPVAAWQAVLKPLIDSLVAADLVKADQQQPLLETMARWMPGLVAAGFFLQSMLSLFLARWWQALLYNPGGFRREFHRLRMHRGVAVVTLLALLLKVLGAGGNLLDYVVILLLVGWLLQGLALIHGLVGIMKMNAGWLVGLYALLVLVMPQAVMVISAVGFADAWIDFRARLGGRSGPDTAR